MRIFPRKKHNYCEKCEHCKGRAQCCISPFVNDEQGSIASHNEHELSNTGCVSFHARSKTNARRVNEGRVQFCISPFINYEKPTNRELEQRIFKRPFTSFQTTTRSLRINEIYGRSCTSVRSSSEPLAEVQRALLVVLVLHAPHPEAGGLLGLRKLREHSEKSEG
jgi:hypothetical protein